MITCDFCLFSCSGSIVCLSCPTGYEIENCRHPEVGQTFAVTRIVRMSARRVNGKIEYSVDKERETTGLTVTAVLAETRELEGRSWQISRLELDGHMCVVCGKDELRMYFDSPERCPNCGKQGLRGHVVFDCGL